MEANISIEEEKPVKSLINFFCKQHFTWEKKVAKQIRCF
jgi:hypothetical protein